MPRVGGTRIGAQIGSIEGKCRSDDLQAAPHRQRLKEGNKSEKRSIRKARERQGKISTCSPLHVLYSFVFLQILGELMARAPSQTGDDDACTTPLSDDMAAPYTDSNIESMTVGQKYQCKNFK